jgi:hypothetical protein
MKIQLNTTDKIIKIEESVNLNELLNLLEQMLPNELWKEYMLETNTIINNWQNPIIWPVYPIYPTPYYPWQQQTIWNPLNVCDSSQYLSNGCDSKTVLTNGIYNIEI